MTVEPVLEVSGSVSGYCVRTEETAIAPTAGPREGREWREVMGAVADAGVGLWEWDVQTGQIAPDERWAQMAGYDLAAFGSLPYASWLATIHPDDVGDFAGRLRGALCGEAPIMDCRHRVRHRDGHWVWVRDRARVAERDHGGQPTRVVGTRLDISEFMMATDRSAVELALERVRTAVQAMVYPRDWLLVAARVEVELRALLEFYKCAVNTHVNSSHAVESWSVHGCGTHSQPPWEDHPVFGTVAQTGKPVYRPTRLHPLFDPGIETAVQSVVDVPFAGGTLAVSSLAEWAFSDGDIELLARFAAVLSEGHLRVLDMTARTDALARLHDSEEQYRELCEGLPIGMVQVDAKGVLLYSNPTARRMLGLRDEAPSDGEEVCLLGDDNERERVLAELGRYGAAWCEQTVQLRGQQRYVRCTLSRTAGEARRGAGWLKDT